MKNSKTFLFITMVVLFIFTLNMLSIDYVNASSPEDMPLLRQGDSGEEVRKLQELLQSRGFYSYSIDGKYGYHTLLAVKKFQNISGLNKDGVAGPRTWRELLDESNLETAYYQVQPGDSLWNISRKFDITVEQLKMANNKNSDHIRDGERLKIPDTNFINSEIRDLHWSRVDSMIPVNNTVILTELESGLSFQVKRLGGSNHADVEPLTSRDTRILRQIYGGSWSWERKAVVVHTNNQMIAGSINGVPHGGQSIWDNNFNGHICLHFKGSRLHKNDTIEPEHQKNVEVLSDEDWPLF